MNLRPATSLTLLILLVGALASPASGHAQFSVSTQCTTFTGPTCIFLRFVIASQSNPVAFTSVQILFDPSASWAFTGGPAGLFTAEDDFSFGVPYAGSTSIGAGGRNLFIAFLSPPSFELTPFSSGYIGVPTNGNGSATFMLTATDPDANQWTAAGNATAGATVTPEPLSVLLLGSGLAGIAAIRKRRRPR